MGNGIEGNQALKAGFAIQSKAEDQLVCGAALGSANSNKDKDMDNPDYYTTPHYLRFEGEDFDRVKGKTEEELMKDLEDRLDKLMEAQKPIMDRAFERLRKKWVREELAKIREKKRKRRLARKAKAQKAKASASS